MRFHVFQYCSSHQLIKTQPSPPPPQASEEKGRCRGSLTSFQKTGSYRVVSHLTSCTLDSFPEPPPGRCCSAFDFLTWSRRKLPGPQQTPSCLLVRPAAGSGRVTSAIAAVALAFSCLKPKKGYFFPSISLHFEVQIHESKLNVCYFYHKGASDVFFSLCIKPSRSNFTKHLSQTKKMSLIKSVPKQSHLNWLARLMEC